MKTTGIVRRIDALGRAVIPKELRRNLSINENDPIEIFTDEGYIILKKYSPGCSFCENAEIALEIGEKRLCTECLKQLKAGL